MSIVEHTTTLSTFYIYVDDVVVVEPVVVDVINVASIWSSTVEVLSFIYLLVLSVDRSDFSCIYICLLVPSGVLSIPFTSLVLVDVLHTTSSSLNTIYTIVLSS